MTQMTLFSFRGHRGNGIHKGTASSVWPSIGECVTSVMCVMPGANATVCEVPNDRRQT